MSTLPGPGPVFEYRVADGLAPVAALRDERGVRRGLLVALGSVWVVVRPRRPIAQPGAGDAGDEGLLRDRRDAARPGAPGGAGGDGRGDLPRQGAGHAGPHAGDRPLRRRDRPGQAGGAAGPVLGLIACTLPVVASARCWAGSTRRPGRAPTRDGRLAVLGCSLALTLSVWARKTHEVLMATYLILGRLAAGAGRSSGRSYGVLGAWADDLPTGSAASDPFPRLRRLWSVAAWRRSRGRSPRSSAACLAGLGGLVTSGRPAGRGRSRPATGQAGGTIAARRARRRRAGRRTARPAASRSRRSTQSRALARVAPRPPVAVVAVVWGLYAAGSRLLTAGRGRRDVSAPGGSSGADSLWVNGFQVAVGILLLSVGASTSLAEERVRGSLDVLMTHADVDAGRSSGASGWGPSGSVPWLAVLPTVLAAGLACAAGAGWPCCFLLP